MWQFKKWDSSEETYVMDNFPDYLITKSGKVISPPKKYSHKEPILRTTHKDKDGYSKVTLVKDGVRHTMRVNRLVAMQFIPNPKNLPIVNHIDEDKTNDHVSNLEWTDNYGNWKHSEHVASKPEIKVLKIDKDTDEILAQYRSLMEAARANGINQGNITNCLKGRCKSVGGYKWRTNNE